MEFRERAAAIRRGAAGELIESVVAVAVAWAAPAVALALAQAPSTVTLAIARAAGQSVLG